METVVTAGQAAERLGVSTSQLRRYIKAYERVHGTLARDGRGRVYTVSVVEKIETAHAQLAGGRFVSLEAALVAARDGELPAAPLPGRGDAVLVTLSDHADRLGRIEDLLLSERDELRRRNAYLLGELQRRDAEASRRRWWWRAAS